MHDLLGGHMVTIDQLASLLVKSRLATKGEAGKLLAAFQEGCYKRNAPDSAELFCDFLTASDRLTAWQCEKLRQGKWKGFYFDDYVLLERIGKDSSGSIYYKVRDTRDRSLACLAVTLRTDRSGPRLEYRIGPYDESMLTLSAD